MKLQKKNRPLLKNPLMWLIAIIVLLLIFIVLEKARVIDFIKTPVDTMQGPTAEQKDQEAKADSEKKKDFIENTPTNETPVNTPAPDTNIEINARQEANDSVTVFTKLYGYSSGTCELTVTNGAKTSSQTAEVVYQPEFSSCAGFSVPIGPLGKGSWTIKLTATSAGTTKDKTITFEVR